MFCKYCGKTLKDGSKFCKYCGSQLEKKEKTEATGHHNNPAIQEQKTRSKKRLSKGAIIGIAVGGIVVVAAVILVLVFAGVFSPSITIAMDMSSEMQPVSGVSIEDYYGSWEMVGELNPDSTFKSSQKYNQYIVFKSDDTYCLKREGMDDLNNKYYRGDGFIYINLYSGNGDEVGIRRYEIDPKTKYLICIDWILGDIDGYPLVYSYVIKESS